MCFPLYFCFGRLHNIIKKLYYKLEMKSSTKFLFDLKKVNRVVFLRVKNEIWYGETTIRKSAADFIDLLMEDAV